MNHCITGWCVPLKMVSEKVFSLSLCKAGINQPELPLVIAFFGLTFKGTREVEVGIVEKMMV